MNPDTVDGDLDPDLDPDPFYLSQMLRNFRKNYIILYYLTFTTVPIRQKNVYVHLNVQDLDSDPAGSVNNLSGASGSVTQSADPDLKEIITDHTTPYLTLSYYHLWAPLKKSIGLVGPDKATDMRKFLV